ncbi:MAG TPA: MFS transporter [Pyrinomonadaceae bacterium]|jgi:MFS family permease|nr:MFS transporter [Pyrinomonadaceae bacterium]
MERKGTTYALAVLFAINALNFFDRQILGAVAEPVRKEWGLSDAELGWLGTAFTLVYAAVGVPLGRLTDSFKRTRLLAGGVFVWSLLTAVSGLVTNYWQLFATRLGVGVGEASCAPAATSLIGDLYPAEKRSKALSVFMLGLPVGIAISYAVSGLVAHRYGWRAAFYVAGLPGLVCVLAVLLMKEPARGATESHAVGARRREGSPYRLVLTTPTMWWIIASGALQTFNMYAIGSFLTPFLMRYHGMDIQKAGFVTMVVFGLSGIPGLVLGGYAADAWARRRRDGRMLLGTLALLASAPLIYFALEQPHGATLAFILLMGTGVALMNMYYSTVYPSIHDVTEPSLRGTAMSLYFFAMYVLGAALGPVGTGLASDYFTGRAAREAGVADAAQKALEPFRAEGLHAAMYVIPALGLLLTLVLFAGSRTIKADMERLGRWMRGGDGRGPLIEHPEEALPEPLKQES